MKLTDADLDLLISALESHVYWQLSETHYRNNGGVDDPGSDDPDEAEAIVQANELGDRLAAEAARRQGLPSASFADPSPGDEVES